MQAHSYVSSEKQALLPKDQILHAMLEPVQWNHSTAFPLATQINDSMGKTFET